MELPPEDLSGGKKTEWALGDLFKRALVAGVGALFMTEEGIRSLLGDLKMPKEAVQFVVTQVSRTKEDLFRIIAGEVRGFLESTDLGDEFRRVLASTSLEISTTVRFVNNEEKLKPRAKTKVKVTGAGKKKKEKEEA